MLLRPYLLVILAGLVCATAMAAAPPDELDRIVLSEMKRQSSPAVAVAVVKHGRAMKTQGYGFANVEHQVRASGRTLFQTGSVGKQFTAALVMLLVRDGKLKLDDPVSKYLLATPDAWRDITVRQLLTHTAGLESTDPAINLRRDYTEQALLASAYKLPLRRPPGTDHHYSNLGYQVLGVLCSTVGGKFWGDQLRERVFAPLGMHSQIISERNIVAHRAAGYDRYDGVLENQAWVAPSQNTTADGSLYVSAADMVRWSRALDSQQLLTDAEKAVWWTPAVLNDGHKIDYGLGWKLLTDSGHRMARHRGDWQGFTAHILHLPDDHLTISVLMNRARGQPHVIADRIAAHYLPALRKPPPAAPSTAALVQSTMYVRGGMNGWGTSTALTPVEPGLLQARIALAPGMQQFKIADAQWQVANLGARFDEAVVHLGRPQLLDHQGEDLFLEVTQAGEYTFELDLRSGTAPRLRVIPPTAVKVQ